MKASKLNSIALSADMFHRSAMKHETMLSSAEYRALLLAAREKNRMPQFYKWQQNRKIVIKD